MLGELNNQQIENFINSQVIARIGCYADNKIYVVPVSYAYDGTYIYAHSREGLKIQMMRKNPEVCFEIDSMQNMANWQSVIAHGYFEELKDKDAREKGMKILTDRLMPLMVSETAKPEHELSKAHQYDVKGSTAIVFRIKLHEKTGRFEKR